MLTEYLSGQVCPIDGMWSSHERCGHLVSEAIGEGHRFPTVNDKPVTWVLSIAANDIHNLHMTDEQINKWNSKNPPSNIVYRPKD